MSARAESSVRPPAPALRLVSSHRPTAATPGPRLPNAVIAMLVFLGAEIMVFGGMISVLLVLRANADVWPPPGQPRLPLLVTAANTLVLLASGFAMQRAYGSVGRHRPVALVRWLAGTAALGAVFLLVQGREWINLVRYGLRFTANTYAATFYTLIGAHGMHVLAGLIVLLVVLRRAAAGAYTARQHVGLDVARLYWFFVVGIWPVLYVLVYLT